MNINRLIKDLKNGNNPEENLSVYSQLLLSSYIRLTYGKLALGFTEGYDYLEESEDDFIREALAEVVCAVRDLCAGEQMAAPEKLVGLASLRDRVITAVREMEDYLCYFEYYEYTLNRLKYQFEGHLENVDTDGLVSKCIRYIDEAKDAQENNERIQNILGELPLRLTTMKFFELLENGCFCYAGARSDMADSFFARMAALAKGPDIKWLNARWGELYRAAVAMDGLSGPEPTRESYMAMRKELDLAVPELVEILSNLMELLDLSTELYILTASLPYAVALPSECQTLGSILKAYIKAVDSGDFLDIDEDILGGLSKTVDDQEKYLGEHMFMEDALDSIFVKYEGILDGLMLGGIYKVLLSDERLFMSGSREVISELTPYYTVGPDELRLKVDALKERFKESFQAHSQREKRYQISRSLRTMPVPFNNLEDVEAFIRQSLEGCSNPSERMAVQVAIGEMMEG